MQDKCTTKQIKKRTTKQIKRLDKVYSAVNMIVVGDGVKNGMF